MNSGQCRNQNHVKMNVTVRHCSSCGEVVNKDIKNPPCSKQTHAQNRKNRDTFCINCGINLKVL